MVIAAVVAPVDQTKVVPGVVELAVKVAEVVTQVKVAAVGDTLRLGAVWLAVTTTSSVEVQLLAGSVAVTVYVPAVVTVIAAVDSPELQAKVALAVVEVAVKVALGVRQVNTRSGPPLTFGGVTLPDITDEPVAVQPSADVTVTV